MIPVDFRLDSHNETVYIEKVLDCIDPADRKKYSDAISDLLNHKTSRKIVHVQQMIDRACKKYRPAYPDDYYLRMWLVAPYEELEWIQRWLSHKVSAKIKKVNNALNRTKGIKKKEITSIKSYCDLIKRRKRTYTNPNIKPIIDKTIFYDEIYQRFEPFVKVYESFSKKGINSWIIEETDLRVCPYCNISYTYNRGSSVTAQLDHFFPKSEFPLFALCFYNLVPSCSACNRIKRDGMEVLASPYKDGVFRDLHLLWAYKKGSSGKGKGLAALEDDIEIEIITPERSEQRNVEKLKLKEAYTQHRDYATEMIKKMEIYGDPVSRKLICDIYKNAGITPAEVKRFYFSNYLEETELKKHSLSKLSKDFYDEYFTKIQTD